MAETSVKLIPRETQTARFLTEEQQAKYEEICKPYGEKARMSLNGATLWKVLLLNQNGIRTATLPELDLIAETSPDFLRGTYEDAPAVVLRSAGDSHAPNEYVAKGLAKLIKRSNFSHTVVIEGLKLKEDNGSDYGLSCEKGKGFRVIEAPAFDHKNHERKFKRINPDYTIDFDDKGERTLYTRDNGVSGLCLFGVLGLNSRNEDLAVSNDNGRIAQKLWLGFYSY